MNLKPPWTPPLFPDTVDIPQVCNDTIYLDEGSKSAAILRLTSKDFYDTTPLNCLITFKAPQHNWSGLTGVLEEVDLRRYEDTADHHLAQNQCVDYIKVLHDTSTPQDEQCGSWSVSGVDKLSHIGFRRALFGYCPNPPMMGSVMRCGVSELRVQVSIGARDFTSLRKKPWRSYRGFTFVVTAYKYSLGERGCKEGFQSCGKTDYHGYQHHCIHKSLWCDQHINCGQPENTDEIHCDNDEMLSGLVTVMVGPWVGAALLVVLVLAGVLYWRRARPTPTQGPPQHQDHNSYAESYEVSSTMSSAHHMAIQVRVVCNSGQCLHTPRMTPWQAADLPPSYDSLFPQGPPPPKSTITSATSTTTTTTTTSAASFNISTTSLVSTSIASNVNASSVPPGFYSNTTQTSSIVIPISAICNNLGSPSMGSTPYSTTTFTNTITACPPTFTNTTTSTTTISSVGASPAALASISVTSVSLAGPSGNHIASKSKDNDILSLSRDNRSSNNSSRATTPNPCPKVSSPARMINATPPLVEPEDTNLTPCTSNDDTPASAEAHTLYSFQDAIESRGKDLSHLDESAASHVCDSVALSPRSNTAMYNGDYVSNVGDNPSRPSTMTASCTGSCDCETSDRPDSESEETEEITLDDEEMSSRAMISRPFDEEVHHTHTFNTQEMNFNEEMAVDDNEMARGMLLQEMEEGMIHESSQDKDDESLL
ncbi:serine-rich adhesin for platelets-like [Palaemon carinicauda]|uniref:serine-rich adhesin for platelets-like n=1 Tax=Palaemon carinicauda TaxID=392227 RepID=UPI0035B6063D